ncbi:MAG: hypothetical protein RLZZ04_3631 [Cyanobacteriota bacterium]|jgi:hypothetical protein
MTKKMSKAVKLKINSNSRSIKKINQVDPYEVRKLILDQRYEDLMLIGIPVEEYHSGIHLWVEQDVDFLIESCQHLEELIIKKKEFEHYSFLNDGLLQIKALISNKSAKVSYQYCPKLNKDSLISSTEQISREQYLWQWRNLAYDLLNIIDV